MSRRAAILGYGAVPVGTYQRAAAGREVLEHELATGVVLEAAAMAGLSKADIDGVVVAHPGDHTRQGYFHTFLTAHLGIRARATVIQVVGNGMTGGHAFDMVRPIACCQSGFISRPVCRLPSIWTTASV